MKSHIRAKNELTLYSPSGQRNVGALVVNMTGDVRRVAKSPPVPREEVSRIRQTKYADSSHSNTRASQGTLGQGVAALQNTLVQKYCEILPHPRPTWSRTIPPHLGPKAPQKRLISKVSKPFGQSLPNPWLSQLRGKPSAFHGKTL